MGARLSKEEDFVRDRRTSIERIAVSLGISPEVAAMIGAEWDADTRREWSRCRPYIAARSSDKEQAKQQAVAEVNRSGRVVEAAERNGISRATMYRLLKK